MRRGMLMSVMFGLSAGAWVFAAAADNDQGAAPKKAAIGEAAPAFTLPDSYGKDFTLSELKGKIVVLEWLNGQCPVSKGAHEKQSMQKTYAKYAGKGVVWLGVDSTDGHTADQVRVQAAEQMVNYPVLHDPEGKVGKSFGATNTPHMFVIDKEGKLVYSGSLDDKNDSKTNYVAAALDDLLDGKPVKTSKTAPYGCGVHYAHK